MVISEHVKAVQITEPSHFPKDGHQSEFWTQDLILENTFDGGVSRLTLFHQTPQTILPEFNSREHTGLEDPDPNQLELPFGCPYPDDVDF